MRHRALGLRAKAVWLEARTRSESGVFPNGLQDPAAKHLYPVRTSRFKARDVYEFYAPYPPAPPLGSNIQTRPALPDRLKHHVVVDLRKSRNMGFLGSRAYKGR